MLGDKVLAETVLACGTRGGLIAAGCFMAWNEMIFIGCTHWGGDARGVWSVSQKPYEADMAL